MATVHLTNDNGVSAYGESKNHIGGVSRNGASHLVVIRQANAWNGKEFVVTPTDLMYNQGWSLGEEVYSGQQGGSQVYNDTEALITNVKNSINNHAWKQGNCALFAISSRGGGPYAWYNNNFHYDATMPNPTLLSEYGASVVAYKLNLHRLHLSRMENSWSAYLRVWAPSLVIGGYGPQFLPTDGTLIGGPLYNQGSTLRAKFFPSLPQTPTWDMADNGDSFELANNCNNGTVVYSDTLAQNRTMNYVSFGGRKAFDRYGNSSRIFSAQQLSYYPTNFYHDFQIANSGNIDFLKKNPAEFWLVCHFHMGNAFSRGDSTADGLAPRRSSTVYAERVELVLKCTSAAFNN